MYDLFFDPCESRGRKSESLARAVSGGKLDSRRQRYLAITVTAANVIAQSGAKIGEGIAGETITRGMAIYENASDSKLYKCDANASAAAAAAVGIALQDVAVNQRLEYAKPGSRVAFGSGVLTAGKIYGPGGTTAGDINPSADFASGWYTTILGYAEDTSILNMKPMCVTNVAN